MSEYLRNYHDFLHKSVEKVLLASKETIENADQKVLSFYKHYEGFESFETNPLVLYRAFQLDKEHHFTHVTLLFSHNEFIKPHAKKGCCPSRRGPTQSSTPQRGTWNKGRAESGGSKEI